MGTILNLVRHGETEWNKQLKFQGCRDVELSKEGREQALFLKKRFNGQFDVIYTSPLKRAIETAKIISNEFGFEPIILNDIREIDFGKWEGLTIQKIAEQYPKEFKIWRTDKKEAPMCDGDLSIKNASIRAKDAIIEVVKQNQNKNIVIVAHGGIIKAGIIGLFELDMSMYHKMLLGNTAVTQINFNENLEPVLVKFNDMTHLDEKHKIKSFV